MADNSFTKKLKLGIDGVAEKIKVSEKELIKFGANELNKELGRFKKEFESIFVDIVDNFKVSITDAVKELNNMLGMSKLSNRETRNLAFNYGFNASQAYGWQNAMDMLGFNDEEDLFYANTQELKQFREAFNKYSDYYTKLYDDGFFSKMQEYQFEMQDFKKEMQMQVIDFIIDNKDIIIAGMEGILKLTDITLKGFEAVLNFFGRSASSLASSDIVNNYDKSIKSTSLNVNNNFCC